MLGAVSAPPPPAKPLRVMPWWLALLLAARRQWINERGQRHQEAVDDDRLVLTDP